MLGIVLVVVVFAFGFYLSRSTTRARSRGCTPRVDALYYAVSTLATIGYGDVHAVGQAARVLVLVQVVFDFVFVAAAASLLTTHLRTAAQQRAQELAADPRGTPYAAEAEVRGGVAGAVRLPCARPVALAVLRRAQV